MRTQLRKQEEEMRTQLKKQEEMRTQMKKQEEDMSNIQIQANQSLNEIRKLTLEKEQIRESLKSIDELKEIKDYMRANLDSVLTLINDSIRDAENSIKVLLGKGIQNVHEPFDHEQLLRVSNEDDKIFEIVTSVEKYNSIVIFILKHLERTIVIRNPAYDDTVAFVPSPFNQDQYVMVSTEGRYFLENVVAFLDQVQSRSPIIGKIFCVLDGPEDERHLYRVRANDQFKKVFLKND